MKLQSFNEDYFDNIIHISKELYDLEKPCSNILIKPDFGVNTITSKMLHKIAYKEKISPENISTFIKIHDARYNEYCKRSKSYTAIYSKQGILEFLEKGDYLNKNFGCIINSNQEVNTFYNFVKHELIPKHCYSEEESLNFLKSLI